MYFAHMTHDQVMGKMSSHNLDRPSRDGASRSSPGEPHLGFREIKVTSCLTCCSYYCHRCHRSCSLSESRCWTSPISTVGLASAHTPRACRYSLRRGYRTSLHQSARVTRRIIPYGSTLGLASPTNIAKTSLRFGFG